MDLKTGDTLFLHGDGVIEHITFSDVRHVAIVYNNEKVFETDWKYGRAAMHPLKKYEGKNISVHRYVGSTDLRYRMEIIKLCHKYDGTPYSLWDIFNNIWTFPLHPTLRKKIVSGLGTKWFMICSEISAKIQFEATGQSILKDHEGLQPTDLKQIMMANLQLFPLVKTV